MVKRPLGAQISHMLKARGIDVVFGIPGVHNIEMYRGIQEAGLQHVLARHEQGAAFMADGYARATGGPGVCFVITGPGLCNALTALGQAYSDSVPVLAISSCLDETASRRGQLHQMIDQAGAAATVCASSLEGRSSDAVYDLIDRALNEFATARPRPRHIQVSVSLSGTVSAPARKAIGRVADRPRASSEDVEEAARILSAAKKPLAIFGGGAVGADSAAREVVDKSGAAVFTTYAGRGVIHPEHPLCFGAYLARPESERVIGEADVVLAVGTELSEVDLWRNELGVKGTVIRVDIDPAELNHPHSHIAIISDAKLFLEDLALLLPGKTSSIWSSDYIAKCKERWQRETDAERPGIVSVCEALANAVPPDAMIYSDMTQFAYVAKEVWPMYKPGHWHHPYGFGTLGYALPAAIGGALGRCGKPTLCIAGDYGFQYTVQELGTAVEMSLPLPIVVWDNGKLKEIEESMIRSQIAPSAVIARNPDFCALANAYGAYAARPESTSELIDDLTKSFNADKPTLIHVAADIASR